MSHKIQFVKYIFCNGMRFWCTCISSLNNLKVWSKCKKQPQKLSKIIHSVIKMPVQFFCAKRRVPCCWNQKLKKLNFFFCSRKLLWKTFGFCSQVDCRASRLDSQRKACFLGLRYPIPQASDPLGQNRLCNPVSQNNFCNAYIKEWKNI